MKTTLTTSVLTALSLLVAISSSQAGNSFPADLRDTNTVETPANPLKAQAFGNGRYIALGSDGKLRCSTSGIEWSPACPPVEGFLRGVAFGNGRFVAVGGSYLGGGPVVLTSLDGRSWNQRRCPSKQVLHGVAYCGDRFIAVGAKGTILTSKSAQSWQKQNSGTDATLASVASGNGICVIGGDDGFVLSSLDTVVWKRQLSGTGRFVGRIFFDHERFVAKAGDLHLESSDGSHWAAMDSATVPGGGRSSHLNGALSRARNVE